MPSRRPASRRPAALVALLAVAVTAGCGFGGGPDGAPAAGAPQSPSATTAAAPSVPAPAVSTPPSAPASKPASKPAQRVDRSLTTADRAAGLRSRSFPQRGSGRLVVVPGTAKAPHAGRVVRVRVEVEGGLKVDGAAFAAFALATLNDRRSWSHDGYAFARTDGAADVRLVLASPDTSARMCRPLRTFGRLSCHSGGATVITVYRWVRGIDGYGADLTGYRHYVVNHEVGHALGHGHLSCPGRGKRAPVMMQQTKGLKGCTPNGWPYP